MANDRKRPPTRSESGKMEAREREARLSGALRDNLLKRKMQQRARAEEADHSGPPERPEGAAPSPAARSGKAPSRKT